MKETPLTSERGCEHGCVEVGGVEPPSGCLVPRSATSVGSGWISGCRAPEPSGSAALPHVRCPGGPVGEVRRWSLIATPGPPPQAVVRADERPLLGRQCEVVFGTYRVPWAVLRGDQGYSARSPGTDRHPSKPVTPEGRSMCSCQGIATPCYRGPSRPTRQGPSLFQGVTGPCGGRRGRGRCRAGRRAWRSSRACRGAPSPCRAR
jgi:hypothetical protein